MPFRMIGATLLIAVFAMTTIGCYGSQETDDVAYVLVIGTDKAPDGKIKATYQIAVPGVLGGESSGQGGGGGKQENPKWILNSITAETPAQSRMLLNTTIARYPNVSHCNVFIYSEEIAREGLGPYLAYNMRSRELRGTMFLIIVPGSAEEFMKRNKPRLELTVAKFYETSMMSSGLGGYFMRATQHDFYTRLKNCGGSPYAVYGNINPKSGEEKPAGPRTPEQKDQPYIAGGVPRTGTENPVEFLGLAVFRGDKMVGVLNSDETRAVIILQGKFENTYVGLVDPLKPGKDFVGVNIRTAEKPKITADLTDGKATFDVKVLIEAEILGITSGINYEAPDYRPLLEQQIATTIKGQIDFMIKHTQELGTDPVGFGLYLRSKMPNTKVLEQTDLTTLYQNAAVRIAVTAIIRRPGLDWRTSPVLNN